MSDERIEAVGAALRTINDRAKYLSEPAWNLEGCALVGADIFKLAGEALAALRDLRSEDGCPCCASIAAERDRLRVEAVARTIFLAIFPDDSWEDDAMQEQWCNVAKRALNAAASAASSPEPESEEQR